LSNNVFNSKSNTDRLNRVFWQTNNTPWEQVIPPMQLSPHVYYIGGEWVGVTIIDTAEGLIMIDAGMPPQLYAIFEDMRMLGLDPKNIKKLLISHAHYDHCGAAKAIVEHTGAMVYASREDLDALEGKTKISVHDVPYTGVAPDHLFSEDEPIILGDFKITTMLTAGHTAGTTSFFFQDHDDAGNIYNMALHGGMGLNTLHFKEGCDKEAIRKARKNYRENMEKLKKLHIDITCTNHPAMADLIERYKKNKDSDLPFRDVNIWGNMIDHFLGLLDSLELQQP